MGTPSLPSPPCGSHASIQSERHRALAQVYKIGLRFGETSSHSFPQFPSPVCVHKVSQVGAAQARIELQVVILEWLGTAAKLTVHLAQVSQVDRALSQVDKGPTQFVAIGLVAMTRMTFYSRLPPTGGCEGGCGDEISLVVPLLALTT